MPILMSSSSNASRAVPTPHAILKTVIDLHTHTTHSDGTLTPREVVTLGKQVGLAAIAITDHDTIDGLGEAVDAGDDLGIEVVPGVELNCEHRQVTLDMLGYFFGELPGDEFEEQLHELRAYRDERNARMLARLGELGYPLDADDLVRAAGGRAVGRPHIGEAMRRRGYVDSVADAFERFLRRGAPAWVDRRRLSLGEAVRIVRRAGGIAVIAHPGIIRTDHAGLARLVREAARCGVGGIECHYPSHDDDTVRRCLALALDNDLAPTGGSDFHGDAKPDIPLGRGAHERTIDDGILEGLKAAWRRQRSETAPAASPACD
jgi:3',5'-nucleoside bisphosphate phosphatase